MLHQRIEEAKKLLGDPMRRIAEIAARVGFVRQEHFSKHFRLQTGLSPSTYRGMVLTKHVLRRLDEAERP